MYNWTNTQAVTPHPHLLGTVKMQIIAQVRRQKDTNTKPT